MDDNSVAALKRPLIGAESEPKRLNGTSTPIKIVTETDEPPAAPTAEETQPSENDPNGKPRSISPAAEQPQEQVAQEAEPEVKAEAEVPEAAPVAPAEPKPEPSAEPGVGPEVEVKPVVEADLVPQQNGTEVTTKSSESETEIEAAAHITEHENEEGSEEGSEEEEEDDPARQAAIQALTDIEVEYTNLRMRIHNDQAARIDLELELCSQGLHPELELVEAKIAERRDHRHRHVRSVHQYQLACLGRTIQAQRAALHQQFAKDAQDVRTELLRHTTREWYQVNDERRAADKLVPEYGYRADAQQYAQMQAQQAALIEVAQHCGFPAAPTISGVSDAELESDLGALGKS